MRLKDNTMTCEAFIDCSFRLEQRLNDYIQDSYWSADFSTEIAWEIMLDVAENSDVELIDDQDFDYESLFQNIYDCTEKGLS